MNPEKIYSTVARMSSIYDFASSAIGYKKSVKDFVAQIPLDKNKVIKVLDAGCGTGSYSLAILKQYENAHVTAFDFNAKLVEHLKGKIVRSGFGSRVHLFTGNIEDPLAQIENARFDLIITAGVLEYVPLEKTVENISRFLIHGGYFLNSPVKDTVFGRLVGKLYSCKPYSRAENIRAFESNGLILKKIVTLPWYSPASFKETHIFQKIMLNQLDY